MPDIVVDIAGQPTQTFTVTDGSTIAPTGYTPGVTANIALKGEGAAATTSTYTDVTAPILTSPTDAADGATASTASVSTNEASGTLYHVVTTSATAPSQAQLAAGQDHTGAAAAHAGNQTVSATGVQTITPAPSGLTAETAYFTHFMHEDAATNRSTVVSASGFTTTAAPTGPDTPDVIMGANSLSWFSAANSTKWQDSARTVPATAASDPVYAVADEEGGFLETDDNARRGVLGVDGGVTFIDMASAHLSRAITGTQTMGMTIALRVPTAAYSRLALVASLYDHPSNYWQGNNMLVDENTAVNWLQARTSGGDEVYVASGVDSRGWIVIQAIFEVDSTSTGNLEISEDGVTSTSPAGQTTPSAVIAAPNALDIGLALESGTYTTVNNAEFDLAAFALYDTIPTPTQLADLLTWAGNEVGRTL